MKLSKAQSEIVRKMREGELLMYVGGIDPFCMWHHGYRVNWSTVIALEAKGIIIRQMGNNELITLTPLGHQIQLTK